MEIQTVESDSTTDVRIGKVLLLDGSAEFRSQVQNYMQSRGVETYTAKGADDAHALITALRPEVAVLDLDMPRLDGLAMLQNIKGLGLFCMAISSHGDLSDRVRALSVGADDFLLKPVAMEELFWRVRNILVFRRAANAPMQSSTVDFNGLKVDLLTRALINPEGRAGAPLTEFEIALLRVLSANIGQIVTKDELSEAYHGHSYENTSRSVDVAVSRLRLKLRASVMGVELRSVRNAGYMLVRSRIAAFSAAN